MRVPCAHPRATAHNTREPPQCRTNSANNFCTRVSMCARTHTRVIVFAFLEDVATPLVHQLGTPVCAARSCGSRRGAPHERCACACCGVSRVVRPPAAEPWPAPQPSRRRNHGCANEPRGTGRARSPAPTNACQSNGRIKLCAAAARGTPCGLRAHNCNTALCEVWVCGAMPAPALPCGRQ